MTIWGGEKTEAEHSFKSARFVNSCIEIIIDVCVILGWGHNDFQDHCVVVESYKVYRMNDNVCEIVVSAWSLQ